MYKYLVLFYLVIFIHIDANSQEASSNITDLQELDDDIIHGTLENGLTYYIKHLDDPNHGLKMMFLVETGSDVEKSHEMDFAHHIEHLAFRETENFPTGLKGNSQILTNLGMKDTDLRGMTSGKMTRYWFEVPNNNLQAINTGFLWFKDIANNLDLSQKNIDRERGVLLQEFLAGEATQEAVNIESELNSKLFPCLKNYSNFVEHNKSFPIRDLEEFYKKWYQPDRMSIVLTGYIPNPEEIKQKIIGKFSKIQKDSKPLKIRDCDSLYLKSKPNFLAMGVTYNSKANSFKKPIKIQLYFRDVNARENLLTIKAIERNIKVKIVTTILNKRFKELQQRYNNPGNYYSSYGGKPSNSFKIIVQSDIGFEKEALQNCISTLKQLKTFGILEEELSDIKEEILNIYSPETPSKPEDWMKEITNYIVNNEALPKGKNSYSQEFIRNLSTGDLDGIIKELLSEKPQDIGIIIPEGYKTEISSEEGTRSFITSAFKKKVSSYKLPDVITQLLTDEEKAILTYKEAAFKADEGVLESKKYNLKNGMTIILKSVNSLERNIFFQGFSPYGVSCLPVEDYYSAMFSPSVVTNAGAGNFTKFDLQRFYDTSSSLNLGVSPYVNFNEVGFKARIFTEEIEEYLQLIYLFFTQPRKDHLAFEDWKAEQLLFTASTLSPNNDLIDNLNHLTNDYTYLPVSSKRISAINSVYLSKAYQSYYQLFGDPSKFTFILTGDFDEKEILSLLQKYLGNIPRGASMECHRTLGQQTLKKGPVYRQIKPDQIYQTQNSFYGLRFIKSRKENENWKEELRVKALGLIANRLLFSLRSQKGLSLYFFGAGGDYNRYLSRYEISFLFNCAPEERMLIMQHTQEFINDLKEGKISEEVLKHATNQLLEHPDLTINSTSNMANRLYLHYRFGENSGKPSEKENFILSLTIADITETAKKYFKEEFKFEIVIEENT